MARVFRSVGPFVHGHRWWGIISMFGSPNIKPLFYNSKPNSIGHVVSLSLMKLLWNGTIQPLTCIFCELWVSTRKLCQENKCHHVLMNDTLFLNSKDRCLWLRNKDTISLFSCLITENSHAVLFIISPVLGYVCSFLF